MPRAKSFVVSASFHRVITDRIKVKVNLMFEYFSTPSSTMKAVKQAIRKTDYFLSEIFDTPKNNGDRTVTLWAFYRSVFVHHVPRSRPGADHGIVWKSKWVK